jgi:hypothetical protein
MWWLCKSKRQLVHDLRSGSGNSVSVYFRVQVPFVILRIATSTRILPYIISPFYDESGVRDKTTPQDAQHRPMPTNFLSTSKPPHQLVTFEREAHSRTMHSFRDPLTRVSRHADQTPDRPLNPGNNTT